MMLTTSYNFRYLNPSCTVYPVVKYPNASPRISQNALYLSKPITIKNKVYNAIQTYICPWQAEFVAKEHGAYYIKIDLADMKYISDTIRMPLVVYINGYCTLPMEEYKQASIINEIYLYMNKSSTYKSTDMIVD